MENNKPSWALMMGCHTAYEEHYAEKFLEYCNGNTEAVARALTVADESVQAAKSVFYRQVNLYVRGGGDVRLVPELRPGI